MDRLNPKNSNLITVAKIARKVVLEYCLFRIKIEHSHCMWQLLAEKAKSAGFIQPYAHDIPLPMDLYQAVDELT